jgi:hypothetical protein
MAAFKSPYISVLSRPQLSESPFSKYREWPAAGPETDLSEGTAERIYFEHPKSPSGAGIVLVPRRAMVLRHYIETVLFSLS